MRGSVIANSDALGKIDEQRFYFSLRIGLLRTSAHFLLSRDRSFLSLREAGPIFELRYSLPPRFRYAYQVSARVASSRTKFSTNMAEFLRESDFDDEESALDRLFDPDISVTRSNSYENP